MYSFSSSLWIVHVSQSQEKQRFFLIRILVFFDDPYFMHFVHYRATGNYFSLNLIPTITVTIYIKESKWWALLYIASNIVIGVSNKPASGGWPSTSRIFFFFRDISRRRKQSMRHIMTRNYWQSTLWFVNFVIYWKIKHLSSTQKQTDDLTTARHPRLKSLLAEYISSIQVYRRNLK